MQTQFQIIKITMYYFTLPIVVDKIWVVSSHFTLFSAVAPVVYFWAILRGNLKQM